MASGIAVGDDVVSVFTDFKMKKKMKFVAFKISDDYKKIVVDKMGGTYAGPYSEFENYLQEIEKEKACRYAVVNVHYENQGQARTKICFFTYSSENAKTKDKMVYTSSKSPLKNKLEGCDVDIQGNDLDDVKEVEILDSIKRKFKD